MVMANKLSRITELPAYLSNIKQDILILIFIIDTDHKQINNNNRVDNINLRNV